MRQFSLKSIMLFIIMIASLTCSTANAQYGAGKFATGIEFGANTYQNDLGLRLGVQSGFHFTRRWNLFFGLNYEYIMRDDYSFKNKDNGHGVGVFVGSRFELLTMGKRSRHSTGLQLGTSYNLNYIFKEVDNQNLANTWKMGLSLRQQLGSRSSMLISANWNFWKQYQSWLWESKNWVPELTLAFLW